MTSPLLEGIRVLDVGSYVAAPAAATVMADFGADVVKVEPLDGDAYRTLLAALPVDWFWLMDARNKRSLSVDVKTERGLEILERLIARADVFLTNYREDLLERLGLGADRVRALNARIVYGHVSGYGRHGPEAGRTAFDTTAWWGRSGLMDYVRNGDAPPAVSAPGMGDHATAMALFGAIMAALYRRERTGEGGFVSTSLLANGVWSNSMVMQAVLGGVEWPALKRAGERPRAPLAATYRSADDRCIQLSVLNPNKEWSLLTSALGRPELARDSRFATREARVEHAAALHGEIAGAIAALPLAEVRARLDAVGITYGFAAFPEELIEDPQLLANGIIKPTAAPGTDYRYTVDSPIQIDGEDKRVPARAPCVGEHSAEVLAELGYDEDSIRTLARDAVIGVGR